jgi:hypothetical protein
MPYCEFITNAKTKAMSFYVSIKKAHDFVM